MLDLVIRDATNGKRSLDDLMRAMFARFPYQKGFTTLDLEQLASEVSGRNLKPFFDAYIRQAGKVDIGRFINLAGLEMKVENMKATTPDGTLKPDTRLYATLPIGESRLRLYLTHPKSVWVCSGLRNGDQLLSANGLKLETESEFNDLLNALHVGEKVKLEILRGSKTLQITVEAESYDYPEVKISQSLNANEKQKAIFQHWN